MRSQDRIGFSNSPGSAGDRCCNPYWLLVTSLSDLQRFIATMKERDADRDRVWPRTYNCWIRAPERFESGARQQ